MIETKKYIGKILIGVILVCVVFVGFLYFNNDIGMPRNKLEKDIRTSQKISEDWIVSGSVSDTMAAYISYPSDLSDHTFSVYVNRPGISFGYFFRGGGSLGVVETEIAEFTVENYKERAFVSMNKQRVERLEIDDGNDIEIIEIDSTKPFAIVVPLNVGNISFYNVDGDTVEFFRNPL